MISNDESLAVETVSGGVVYPSARWPDLPKRLMVGATFSDGTALESIANDRNHGSELIAAVEAGRYRAPVVSSDEIDAIYAGVLYTHFGHFLLESLARLWAASRYPQARIVWSGSVDHSQPPVLRGYQRDILRHLGLKNETEVVIEPTRFKTLHVPDPGYRYADWFHPDHAAFLGTYSGPRQESGMKLWLSRRELASGFHVVNSEIWERRLKEAGWTVIVPERLTINEQLDYLCKAEVIAGEEGSAFHLLILLRDVSHKKLQIFRRYGKEHLTFHTIGNRRNIHQEFHSNRNEVTLARKGREVRRLAVNAAEALNKLQVPVLKPASQGVKMSHSARRLSLIKTHMDVRSYLEIGVFDGATFHGVDFLQKVAVDPTFQFDTRAYNVAGAEYFEMTSDQYFINFAGNRVFDLIFLDGLHTFEQTFRDFCNSLNHSSYRTVWVVDNVYPVDKFSAHPDQKETIFYRQETGSEGEAWHGDVFKFVFALHDFFPQFSFVTIRDKGNHQLVIWNSPRPDFSPIFNNLERITRMSDFDFRRLEKHLNLVSEEEALARIKAFRGSLKNDFESYEEQQLRLEVEELEKKLFNAKRELQSKAVRWATKMRSAYRRFF